MSTRYVERLAEERDSLAAQILSLAEKAANENRSLTDDENTAAANMRGKVDGLDKEIRTWSGTSDAFAKFAQISQPGNEKREQAKSEVAVRTLGEQFVASNEFRAYHGNGDSGRIDIADMETRATITTGAAPGSAFMEKDRSFNVAIPAYQTPILSLIGNVQVSSNVVEYVTFPAAAPLAAIVAEGTAKPEAALTASVVSKTLDTVAHWVQITRQALEDSAQLRSWIDGNLTRGVGDKLEALAAAAITGATLPTGSGATLLEAIRVGVGKVQTAGFNPNAVLVNPDDYAKIDIQIMTNANQLPNSVNTLWGLRVVPAAAVAAGTAYVGNFTDGATLFYRNSTSVYLTDSDITGAGSTAASAFRSNIITILAERRALTAVTRAEALVKVTSP